MFKLFIYLSFLYILSIADSSQNETFGPIETTLGSDITASITSSCTQILNCQCVHGSTEEIQCHGIGYQKVEEIHRAHGNKVKRLSIVGWIEGLLDFDIFSDFYWLQELKIVDSQIEVLNITSPLKPIELLILDNNELENEQELCRIISFMPKLRKLSLKNNYFEKFRCEETDSLKELDLTRNKIVEVRTEDSLEKLYISGNFLTDMTNITTNLHELDISNNILSSWPKMPEFPNLKILRASGLGFDDGFEIFAPNLEILNLDDSKFRFLDFHKIKAEKLRSISAAHLVHLEVIAGKLGQNVEEVVLTGTKVYTLPSDFFGNYEDPKTVSKRSVSSKNVSFSSKEIICENCLLRWSLPIFEQSGVGNKCKNISKTDISSANCTIGVSKEEPDRFGFYEKKAILECLYYGTPTPNIRWFRYRPSTILGEYDSELDEVSYDNVTDLTRENYEIISGGSLVIKSANRSHVERYICVAENEHGHDYATVLFRLDYRDWYGFNVFHSVFFGGLAMSLIVCLISFLLNVTWILTRKSALWWIQRAERLSRVRKMVEAMEKYRVRQMESLHDKYTKRVQIVRDNYQQQVEALRVSYSSQSEKFQNYKAQQMESVSSHLESMRDNYNTQLARVRDYGSKRAEALWESYERQANRMRTFSLQHRLKMMRQYKVKQRYLNKLLESLQTGSPDVQLENEEKVRAVLNIADDPGVIDDGTIEARLSRASSFHSLPEYLIDERGNMQPGIPGSGAEVRFSRLPQINLKDEAGPSSRSNY